MANISYHALLSQLHCVSLSRTLVIYRSTAAVYFNRSAAQSYPMRITRRLTRDLQEEKRLSLKKSRTATV